MDTALELLRAAGLWAGYAVVALLCLAGVVLSCLSLFGAWVVALAALLLALLTGPAFPGWLTVGVYVLVAVLLEVLEAVAGAWGVQKRGGSTLAGLAALLGGLAGLVFGSVLVPVPVLGSLVAMMLGGFVMAYVVEYMRLKKASHAAHIAWGAVLGRVVVILAKVMATVCMVGWLIAGSIAAGIE